MRRLTPEQFKAEYLRRPPPRYQCYVCLAVCYKPEHRDCERCWIPFDEQVESAEQVRCSRCRAKGEREAHTSKAYIPEGMC